MKHLSKNKGHYTSTYIVYTLCKLVTNPCKVHKLRPPDRRWHMAAGTRWNSTRTNTQAHTLCKLATNPRILRYLYRLLAPDDTSIRANTTNYLSNILYTQTGKPLNSRQLLINIWLLISKGWTYTRFRHIRCRLPDSEDCLKFKIWSVVSQSVEISMKENKVARRDTSYLVWNDRLKLTFWACACHLVLYLWCAPNNNCQTSHQTLKEIIVLRNLYKYVETCAHEVIKVNPIE